MERPVEWLAEWPVGWLAEWPVGWLAGWPVGWLAVPLRRLVSRTVSRCLGPGFSSVRFQVGSGSRLSPVRLVPGPEPSVTVEIIGTND